MQSDKKRDLKETLRKNFMQPLHYEHQLKLKTERIGLDGSFTTADFQTAVQLLRRLR